MQSMAANGYAAADVLYGLRGIRGRREWAFRYELLSATNVKVADISNMAGASVDHDFLAEIKRTAKFTVQDNGSIDYGKQRIKPWVRLRMPDGGYAEWPLGVFLLVTPERKIGIGGTITREIDAYDQTMILTDDPVTDRYYVSAGYKYTDAVKEILTGSGISNLSIPDSTKTLPVALDWDPGTTKYRIVADLLDAINYDSLWFDGNGVARSAAYVNPASAVSGYTYATDQNSVVLHDAGQQLDYYKVPNRLVLYVSTPDRPPLRTVIVNSSPTSPTSTVSRGRTISKQVEVTDVSDLPTLNDIGNRMMQEENSLFETVKFSTAIMPIHENGDVYTFNYIKMGVTGHYRESKWSMDLEAGATMEHEARRAVVVA